jgi:hypothetical protein
VLAVSPGPSGPPSPAHPPPAPVPMTSLSAPGDGPAPAAGATPAAGAADAGFEGVVAGAGTAVTSPDGVSLGVVLGTSGAAGAAAGPLLTAPVVPPGAVVPCERFLAVGDDRPFWKFWTPLALLTVAGDTTPSARVHREYVLCLWLVADG